MASRTGEQRGQAGVSCRRRHAGVECVCVARLPGGQLDLPGLLASAHSDLLLSLETGGATDTGRERERGRGGEGERDEGVGWGGGGWKVRGEGKVERDEIAGSGGTELATRAWFVTAREGRQERRRRQHRGCRGIFKKGEVGGGRGGGGGKENQDLKYEDCERLKKDSGWVEVEEEEFVCMEKELGNEGYGRGEMQPCE